MELTLETLTSTDACVPAGTIYRQSPLVEVWHLGCAEEASVPVHCVDRSCIRTVQYSTPTAIHASLLENTNRFDVVIVKWMQ